MRQKFVYLILLLCISGFLNAQKLLMMREAIELARQQNLAVRQALTESAAAKQQVRQFLSVGLPQINASGNYSYNIQPQQFVLPGEFFGQPGIFQRVDASPPFQVSLGINASLNLIDGSYIYGLKATRLYSDIMDAQKHRTEMMVIRQVKENYLRAAFLKENLKILQENITDSRRIAFETEQIVKQGFRENVDAQVVRFASDTLELTYRRLEAALEATLLNLKILLKLSPEEKIDVKESLEDLFDTLNPKRAINENTGITSLEAPEISILKLNVKASEINEKVEFSKAFPRLSTYFNWGYAGFNSNKNNPVLFSSGSTYFASGTTWGFSLIFPIFSSFKRQATFKRARLQTETARLQQENTVRTLDAQLRIIKIQLKLALESLQQAEENLKIQEYIREINRKKFKEGLISSFDLLQTDTQFRTSRFAILKNKMDALMLLTAYDYLINKSE